MPTETTVVYRDPFQVTLDIVSGTLPGIDLGTLLQQYPQQIIDLVAEGAKAGGFTAEMVEKCVGEIFRDTGPEGGVLGNINLLGLLSHFTEKYALRPLGTEVTHAQDDSEVPSPSKPRRAGHPRKVAGQRTSKKTKAVDAPIKDQVRAYLGSLANTKRLLAAAGSNAKLAKQIRDVEGIPVQDANFYWILKHTYPELVGQKRSKGRKR
jgi:hypothetical protein